MHFFWLISALYFHPLVSFNSFVQRLKRFARSSLHFRLIAMSSFLRFSRSYLNLLALSGAIAILGGGCQMLPPLLESSEPSGELASQPATTNAELAPPAETAPDAATDDKPEASSTSSSSPNAASPSTSATAPPPAADPFPDAINQASSAFNLSQSAQSRDDWRLVANRWQQAITTMTTVPASSPNHGTAQQKLTEYRRNLTYAQQQAAAPLPERSPGRVIEVPIASSSSSSPAASSSIPAAPQRSQSNAAPAPSPSEGRVYRAPIVRRSGGTPVVLVTFNNNQPFEMIVDTGASGTVITQPVARALGIQAVGETSVATASANNVTFQLGYVDSMEVGGSRRGRMLVAIAGPSLDTGLLGHDFFGRYDVTVRQDVVEFRER